MANPANNGVAVGRLARDPKLFVNNDGSKKYYLDVCLRDNFQSGPDKQYGVNTIKFEGFVPANRSGNIYESLHTGDLVNILYSLRSKSYPDKTTGETVYVQFANIESINPLEGMQVRNERMAKHNSQAQAEAQAPQQAAPAQAAAPQQYAAPQAPAANAYAPAGYGMPAQAPAMAPQGAYAPADSTGYAMPADAAMKPFS